MPTIPEELAKALRSGARMEPEDLADYLPKPQKPRPAPENLVERFRSDLPGFVAFCLEHHLTCPYGPLHLELLSTLQALYPPIPASPQERLGPNPPSPLGSKAKEPGPIKGARSAGERENAAQGSAESEGERVEARPGGGGDADARVRDTGLGLTNFLDQKSPQNRLKALEIRGLDEVYGTGSGGDGGEGPHTEGFQEVSHGEVLCHTADSGGSEGEVRGMVEDSGDSGGIRSHKECSGGSSPGDPCDKSSTATGLSVENPSSHARKIGTKLAIAAPRGHAKSTLVSLGFVLWVVCNRLEEFILLMGDSEDQAALNLDAVKAELEGNERLRAIYGDLVGSTWGSYALETTTGVRIQTRGSGQRIRGLKYRRSRPGLIIGDDLENDENVQTPEQRDKLRRWFYGAVVPAGKRHAKIIVIGTILHQDSLLSGLLEAKGWETKIYGATEDGTLQGVPVWPSAYTSDDLNRIYLEYEGQGQGDLFWREYFNKIVDPAGAMFTRQMFRRISMKEWREIEEKGVRTYGFLDPAYTVTRKADYSAFVIVSVDPQNILYVRDVFRDRLPMPTLIRVWFQLHALYQPQMWGIQSIDWEKSLKVPLTDRMRQEGVVMKVVPLQTYSQAKGAFNKQSRIEQLSPRYNMGSVVHVEGKGIDALEAELLAFPHGKHDDIVDALAQSLQVIFPPKKREPKPIRTFEPYGDYAKLSGY